MHINCSYFMNIKHLLYHMTDIFLRIYTILISPFHIILHKLPKMWIIGQFILFHIADMQRAFAINKCVRFTACIRASAYERNKNSRICNPKQYKFDTRRFGISGELAALNTLNGRLAAVACKTATTTEFNFRSREHE